MKKGKFYGIGVGPGAPDLLTIKAVSAIKESDYIFEVLSGEDKDSISGKIAKQHCRPSVQFITLLFPMKRDKLLVQNAWKNNAEKIAEKVNNGYVCSFVTIGDPMLYSTCSYIIKELRKLIAPSLIEIIPGISSFQCLAAKAQIPIAEGEEKVSIFPAFSENAIAELTQDRSDSIIVMKPYKNKNKISDIAEKMNYNAVYGSNLSMENEDICKKNTDIKRKKSKYLSLFILKKIK